MFVSLHDTLIRISGRLKAESMKERVVKVLRVWTAWSVFPQQFINELENIFTGKAISPSSTARKAPEVKPASLLSSAYADDDEDLDGAPLVTDVKGSQQRPSNLTVSGDDDGSDIDGEPLNASSNSVTRQYPASLVGDDDDVDGFPLS